MEQILKRIEKRDRFLTQLPDGTWRTDMKPGYEGMAAKVTGVRLPKSIDAVVRQLPNRSQFLQDVITKAVLDLPQYDELLAKAEQSE